MGYPASGGRWACVVRNGHFFCCRAHDSTWNNNDVWRSRRFNGYEYGNNKHLGNCRWRCWTLARYVVHRKRKRDSFRNESHHRQRRINCANRIVNNVCTAAATTTTRATGATTTVAGSATTIPGGGILPLTGAYTEILVFFAVVLVVLGIVKIVVDRRRY